MTYFEKNEQKQFFPMFSMLNAIGGIGNVADFTTPCVNITNSAFTQLPYKCFTSLLQLIILNWVQVSGTNDHVRFSDDLHLYIVYLYSLNPLLSQSHYIAIPNVRWSVHLSVTNRLDFFLPGWILKGGRPQKPMIE